MPTSAIWVRRQISLEVTLEQKSLTWGSLDSLADHRELLTLKIISRHLMFFDLFLARGSSFYQMLKGSQRLRTTEREGFRVKVVILGQATMPNASWVLLVLLL